MSDIFNKAIPILPARQENEEQVRIWDSNVKKEQKHLNRSLGAKKAWEKRRARQVVDNTPKPPDRHRAGEPTFSTAEAIALAELIVDYPFLRKLLG